MLVRAIYLLICLVYVSLACAFKLHIELLYILYCCQNYLQLSLLLILVGIHVYTVVPLTSDYHNVTTYWQLAHYFHNGKSKIFFTPKYKRPTDY